MFLWRTPSYCDTPVGLNNSWDILTFASNIRLVQEVRLMTLPTEEVSKCCWANYLLKSPQVAGIAAHQPKVIWRWNTKSVTAPTAEVSNCKHKLISFTLTYSQVDTFHIWWVIWLDCVKPGILSALDSEKMLSEIRWGVLQHDTVLTPIPGSPGVPGLPASPVSPCWNMVKVSMNVWKQSSECYQPT